jgi:Cytochrome b/b6/petB
LRNTDWVRKQIDRGGAVLRYLGVAILVCGVVLAGSGVYLKDFYRPTEATAWSDIQTLHTGVTFGLLVRNSHRWAAQIYILTLAVSVFVCAAVGICHRGRARRWIVFTAAIFALGFVPLWPQRLPLTPEEALPSVLSLRNWMQLHVWLGSAGLVISAMLLLLAWSSWRDDQRDAAERLPASVEVTAK